jgi:hypothetical protein
MSLAHPGPECRKRAVVGGRPAGVEEALRRWADRMGCSAPEQARASSDIERITGRMHAFGEALACLGLDLSRVGDRLAMSPKDVVMTWVEAFNEGDADVVANFYHDDAINHQVAEEPVEGRAAIREMFAREFAAARMVCLIENLFEDGEWAILEWRDPSGLRGSGFFHVRNGKIAFQRGYWDKLSFTKLQGLRPGSSHPAS